MGDRATDRGVRRPVDLRGDRGEARGLTAYLLVGRVRPLLLWTRYMGISPLGWLHTLGSLPAIPLALYMLVKHGRIAPESRAGHAYFWFMLLGVLTVYPIAHQPISSIIATVTLVALLVGYGISRWSPASRFGRPVETMCTERQRISVVGSHRERKPAQIAGEPSTRNRPEGSTSAGIAGRALAGLLVGVCLQMRALYKRKIASTATN